MSQDNESPDDKISSDLVREDAAFADIVTSFVEGLDERLTKMESAINESDYDALRVAAHQLKGSGGGYGYPALTERASQIERFAQQQALSQCKVALGELQELCARVVVE